MADLTTTDLTLGLDIGTTGCKVVALSPTGKVLGVESATYPLLTDASGRAEQDPYAIWEAVCRSLRAMSKVLSGSGLPCPAVSLSGAMHSLVPLGTHTEPLGNAVTWADSRAEKLVMEGAGDIYEDIYEKTGCPPETPYHPARLRWFRKAQPELFSRTQTFSSIKDYVAYRLTGTLATDIH